MGITTHFTYDKTGISIVQFVSSEHRGITPEVIINPGNNIYYY